MDALERGIPEAGAKFWPVDQLRAYDRNPRTHPDAQITRLMGLIEAVGFAGSVVVRDGVIAKGHGTSLAVARLYAAGKDVYPVPGQAAGAKPFVRGTIPVQDASGWTDAQFRAYVVADNSIALASGWDEHVLGLEVQEIAAAGFDMKLVGFEPDDLDKAMKAASVSGVAEVDVSEVADRFWISLRGPLKHQAHALQALRAACAGMEGVEVELGTIDGV